MSAAKTVHLTIAGSAAGNVREVIKGRDLHQLIAVEEWFSVGPLLDISEPGGLEARKAYLRNIFEKIQESSMFQEIESHVGICDIQRIPPDTNEIVVWCGANSDEQVLLRACSIWSDKPIRVVDVRNLNPDYEKRSAIGGCTIDELRLAEANGAFLSPAAVKRLAEEWRNLIKGKDLLHIFVDGELTAVSETYFDPMLIDLCPRDFGSAARLVGTVMGHSPVLVGDTFLNYRLRELIAKGIFEAVDADKHLQLMQVRRR
jgi:hypothetical protein